MILKRILITAKYTAEGLGNRWKDSTTVIILFPKDPPTKGGWTTERSGDIDSSGGTDHAFYEWNATKHIVSLKVGNWQDKTIITTPVILDRFNDIKAGAKGDGTFNFRNKEVPITWELSILEYHDK
jgi:hypothetical protein